MALGGKDHHHLAPNALSVADFPTVKEEEFEAHVVPHDYKVEAHPMGAAHLPVLGPAGAQLHLGHRVRAR